MNYEIERIEGRVKFTFNVDKAEWDKNLEKSYRKNKGKYNIPGFRRGHATRRMIENMYGEAVFFDDAFNSCFKDVYSKALDENEDVYPVDEPEIDIQDIGEEGIKFTAIVTTRPQVKLGKYTGLEVVKAEYPVDEEKVDLEIRKARERLSRKIDVTDRAAQDGDITVIDFSGSVDGVKFEGGTAQNHELVLGSGSFIPGFEEQVVGMKIGETKDINVKFPDEYHSEELKGKPAVFEVVLHAIKVKELPELDDAFAKEASQFETLAEYRADIRKNLEEEAQRREKTETENNLIDKIIETVECEIPQCMIETQINYMVEDFSNRIQFMYRGLKFEDYLKYSGMDMETFRQNKQEEAKTNVKTRLTLEEIIKAEKMDATEAEVEEKIVEIAEKVKTTVEEYKQGLSSIQLGYIKNDVLLSKLMKFLRENNTFIAKPKK